jgi:D-xylono/L-arabinono-1,4-lactonase
MPVPLSNQHCNTGENPLWNPDDQRVYWTDIPRGALYRHTPTTGQTEAIYHGDPVGGFALREDGQLLLFRVKDVATFCPRSGKVSVIKTIDDPTMDRFNDVHVDPTGRVFAGTIGKDWKNVGGLYRFELDGSHAKLFEGTACSNGMAFTPDERQLYWTDTSGRVIYRFDYDRAGGSLTNRVAFYTCPPDEGAPDGMAMDEAGTLYSTRWGGHRICVITPDGVKTNEIRLPVERVSSCAFGGVNNNELFITTAAGEFNTLTEDGTLYRLRMNVRGRKLYRARVGL